MHVSTNVPSENPAIICKYVIFIEYHKILNKNSCIKYKNYNIKLITNIQRTLKTLIGNI